MIGLCEKLGNRNNDKRMYKLISNIIYIYFNYDDTKDGKENEENIYINKNNQLKINKLFKNLMLNIFY